MTQQAESGHIRASVNRKLKKNFAGIAIQRQHLLNGCIHISLLSNAFLKRSGNDTRSDAFGKNEHITRSRSFVGPDSARIYNARYRISELDLVLRNTMSAQYYAA